MTQQERIADILQTKHFLIDEVEKEGEIDPRTFKSWEYSLIVHWSNEELYYDSENHAQLEALSDFKGETPKGTILCFS